MQFKQTLARLFFLLLPFAAFSQSNYLPKNAREYILLERLEIQRQNDSLLNFSKIMPFTRKHAVNAVLPPATAVVSTPYLLDDVDRYNYRSLFINNLELLPVGLRKQYVSRKPIGKHFYKTPANLYEVYTPDFFLAVNPVFQYYVGKDSKTHRHLFLNTRGVTLRGNIANRIGFSAYITDNQERDPLYVRQFVAARRAVPGAGFYKDFKTQGYDYFDARGSISFNAAKFIDMQFGYDKNFIGNGYRSLFLSDFSAPALFFRINTRVWKFNYQNLFMELNSANRLNADQLLPKKYAALHHLDLAVTKWLNFGLFEGVVFGRQNHFEFGYLNPVIFYRSIEQQNGSFDNAVAGFDIKANAARKFQFYGQFLLDEFNLTELRKGSGWWGNKIGYQAGAKYIDAFNVPHLDLQLEVNRVRPFTYSHRDSVANYTHYNQPLAHPLGANFQEWIGEARYQPAPRWLIEARAFYFVQGKDTGNVSFGSNIFLPNLAPYRTKDFGFHVGDAVRGKTALATLLLSYEWRPNFFFEANAAYRREAANQVAAGTSSFIVTGGVRWNMHRRNFDF